MGSIPVGSTKKQTQTCLLLLSRLGIEGRRSVVPIPEHSASSLIHGSTKKQTQTCLLLLSRLEIEGRRSVVPIPVRSASSLMHGSTKKQTHLCLLLLSFRRIERLLTQPDSRTLGVLADTREYQNDCENSRFYMMKRKG